MKVAQAIEGMADEIVDACKKHNLLDEQVDFFIGTENSEDEPEQYEAKEKNLTVKIEYPHIFTEDTYVKPGVHMLTWGYDDPVTSVFLRTKLMFQIYISRGVVEITEPPYADDPSIFSLNWWVDKEN